MIINIFKVAVLESAGNPLKLLATPENYFPLTNFYKNAPNKTKGLP